MPAPRPSYSAEAAHAAALQAEFNEKKWVWVPDEKEGYLSGWINKEEADMGEIVMASGGEIRTVPLYALSRMNPPKFDRVEDIADLTYLNEASVVHNLRLRYGSGNIYTYSGLFLVAINPYQHLQLYTDAIIQQYRNKRRDENPPHIFAVAERAWINMGEERENQSILITGESGAGKTESTKKVIQYLAAIATDAVLPSSPSHSRSPTTTIVPSFSGTMPSTGLPRTGSFRRGHVASPSLATSSGSQLKSKGRLGLLERQILQANPILEAFGNAQTQRNNNSSRFGKFIRISFAPDGSISGANIDWYLLEKSRVVVRNEAERSFHVFYQLLVGAALLLDGNVEDYEYLNKSRREVDGVDDRHEWNALKAALDVVGFTATEQFDLFRILASILHIGNIVITGSRSDDAMMPDPSQAERVCHILGIPIQEFTRAVLRPRVLAGREWVTQARTQQQAMAELGALCKTLYEKSFGALVDRINLALDRPSSKSSFIGVLDIAGFEIFDVNGYEQLLINYTNEKLQQFFNHHMFVLEQEEYAREGIQWEYVNFGLDLQPTIELIESSTVPHIGILSTLDEECIMPKATDLTFTSKLKHMWDGVGDKDDSDSGYHAGGQKYESTRFEQGFMVQHYAGKVEYRTDGWLEKNKDPLNDNLTRVLAASSERYVASLFADYADPASSSTTHSQSVAVTLGRKRALTKKGAFRTVAQRHKEQLASLMAQLHATQPHFVRCIVPNAHKKPGRIDVPLVLDQLRCNGVLEGIRIARLGYPNRLPFVEFRQRYEVLTPGIIPRGYMDGRKAAVKMVAALELNETEFRVGTSKIFFKAGVLARLEERRDALLFEIFTKLQAMARMYSARRQMRKILNRAVAIRTIQRNARVYGELRDWPWWQLYTKVRPLLAATRNDEELRRKEIELALIKERAEKDKQEREAFEKLKVSLEIAKRKVEEELAAERAIAIDKDAIIARGNDLEAELREEIEALQKDIDELDSQLDRAMKIQKESEEKRLSLKDAFDQAAEHLVRLETEQHETAVREAELNEQLAGAQEEIERALADKEELQRVGEELRNLALQREEDLARLKDRMDAIIQDMEGKLNSEQRTKDSLKDKADSLEEESRHAKEQLAELTRTATDYSLMIKSKEAAIAQLTDQLDQSKAENQQLKKEVVDLQNDVDVIDAQVEGYKADRDRSTATHIKLQEEIDELRVMLAAKTSEDTRRTEAEKSRELELANLRQQVATLQQEASESRKTALESQSKLKADLENISREHGLLDKSHRSLQDREQAAQGKLAKTETRLADLEKMRRSLESELQSLRAKQADSESELAAAHKAKESLERQLQAALKKNQDFEDVLLTHEREQETRIRQLESSKKQLQDQSMKYSQLERNFTSQKTELKELKERNAKFDRELNQALDEVKAKEWEVKQLESRQDKTIVEHVHVLQEAKRRTDEQLKEAQAELQRNSAYIRSLEKAKSRLTSEAEDMQRETQREQMRIQAQEKAVRSQETKVAQAMAEVDRHRHAKDVAELETHRLKIELQNVKGHLEEVSEQLIAVQRSKDSLESELERIADGTVSSNPTPGMQRQYELRISELEEALRQNESSVVAKIKERMDRHHAEIRELVLSSGPRDESFQTRLLQHLQLADEGLARQVCSRPPKSGSDVNIPITPSKRQPERTRRDSQLMTPRKPDTSKEVSALKHHVQLLEIQMVASERVRRHLEASVRDLTAELENTDGSKQSIQRYRQRLAEENSRLAQLLQDEVEARRTAEAAQVEGIQSMWTKFQNTLSQERDSYSRLEESRKAIVVQQRAAQEENDRQRAQIRDLTQSRKQLQSEVATLQEQLITADANAAQIKQQLQKRLQDIEIASTTSSAAQSELKAAVEAYKAKEGNYQKRVETAEAALAKATRAEQSVRRSLIETEKRLSESEISRKKAESQLHVVDSKLRALQAKLEDGNRDASEADVIQQRLMEGLDDVRSQHQKDLADRDFAADQTRKKYQAELAQLSEELQSQRDNLSRLREENRTLRSDYDELQRRYDDELYDSGGWKKEKDRLETKIGDLTKAYESSIAGATEQQDQIVSLHSQVRELRSVLNDAEADRALLQKARRALQAELETIKLDHVDTNKLNSDREFQRLNLKKLDLERSLEEQEDRMSNAHERMKRAEAHANDCQVELGKIRVENSELERMNAHLEKQIKELKVRIVDLETKSWTSSPRQSIGTTSRRMDELTSQLNQAGDSSRLRSADTDRQRAKLEEERSVYESQLQELRQEMDTVQNRENELQTAKRRAEREVGEYKQKTLSLEREIERLRNRLDRPASSLGRASPLSPTRK